MPSYYTEIQPDAKSDEEVPEIKDNYLHGDGSKTDQDLQHEVKWLQKVDKFHDSDKAVDKSANVYLGSFHASQAYQAKHEIVKSQILPVFPEASNNTVLFCFSFEN